SLLPRCRHRMLSLFPYTTLFRSEPQYNKPGFLELGVSPEQAPDQPTYVTIHFEKGIPTAVDGKEMGAVELVEYLNQVGGANGIGDRKSTRLNSSHVSIPYAVFCL